MEDYKKKYEQALERCREFYNKLGNAQLKEEVEEIFPELKEDERIRKDLIKYLNTDMNENPSQSDSFYNKCIACLEKQGNFIKWQTNSKDNKPEKKHSILMQTTHGIAEGEWQGELWYQYKWSAIIRDSDVLSWIELSELEKQGEQKPAWSEGDEKICQETIDWFEKKCFPYALESENPARESIHWLKSLKERMKGE